MPAQQESWIATAYLSGATGPIAVGTVLCLNAAGDGYIIATSANRAAAGRGPACIVLSGGDGTNIAVEAQYVGVVPPNITGLGVGAAAFVNVSSAGVLARQGAQDPTTVGKCDADGTAYVCFPFSGLSGGGGFTAGGDLTGTSLSQTVAKIQGVAISGTPTAGQIIQATSGAAASWQTPSGVTAAGVTGDIQVKAAGGGLAVAGYWKGIDNLGTLRAAYWDDADGVTLRANVRVSWGTFNGAETFPSYGFFRLSSGFYVTGGWSFLSINDGANDRGLLGMSGGTFFAGDSSGQVPTILNGKGITIVCGVNGITLQGATAINGGAAISGTTTSSGGYQMANASTLAGRNAGNTAYVTIATIDASNNVLIGANSANQAQTIVYAPSQIYLSVGGGNSFGISTTSITTLITSVSQTGAATDGNSYLREVTTTDATATTLYTFTLANNAVTAIDALITANKSDSSAGGCWTCQAVCRNAAGTAADIQAPTVTARGTAGVGSVSMTRTGTTVTITVTGAAATTIKWGVTVATQPTRQA